MLIGYARVSTEDQDLSLQVEQLKEFGCEKIFMEKQSGIKSDRPELLKALDYLREGDTFVVYKIDRLARSIIDLNNLVKELNAKGVNVRFLKENVEFQAGGKNNPLQALLFNILGSFAQFERDIIVERTREGRERAKKQGKHLGRPGQDKKKIERALKLYHERETNGMSVNDISKLTGVPRSTIYLELKKVAEKVYN
jgi:DNA invertase Pin-like site-specific DNA recombinase